MSESFGKKLRDRRLEKGLTLEELAEIIGSKKAYMWQLENKSPAKPSGELLIKISDALDVHPSFLIEDDKETPTQKDVAGVLFRKMEKENMSVEDVEALIDVINKIRNKHT